MSMDAGAKWTDVTGDVGGESMHPDQHALAFVPGNPSQFFVGSDGGVIRTSGQWANASASGIRHLTGPNLADCKVAEQIPTKLERDERGPGDAADEGGLGEPVKPTDDALAGPRTTARSLQRLAHLVPAAHR